MTNKYEKLKYNTILCFDIASTQFTEELQKDIDDCCAEILKCFDELAEYKKIGTIEQFKALKEKSVAKKVQGKHISYCVEERKLCGEDTLYGNCPNCGELVSSLWNDENCGDCGQALDWND